MTSENQIKIAREMVAAIQKRFPDFNCNVDDWNDQGGFRSFVDFGHAFLSLHRKVNLRSIGALLRNEVKEFQKVYGLRITMPKRLYWTDHVTGEKVFLNSYDNNHIILDYEVMADPVVPPPLKRHPLESYALRYP